MKTNNQPPEGDAAQVPLSDRERAMRQRAQSLFAAARERKRRLAHAEKQELAILVHEISRREIFARGDVGFASLKDYWREEVGETSTVKLGQICAYGELLTQFADARKLRAGEKELRPLIASAASAEAKQRCLVRLLAAEAKSGKAVNSAQVVACLEEAERLPVIEAEPLIDSQPTGRPATTVSGPAKSITPPAQPAKTEKAEEPRKVVVGPEQIIASVMLSPAPATRAVRQPEIARVNKSAPAVPAPATAATPKPQGGTPKATKNAPRYVPAHLTKGAPPGRKYYAWPNSKRIYFRDPIHWSRHWPRCDTQWKRFDLSLLFGIWFLVVIFSTWSGSVAVLRDQARAEATVMAEVGASAETGAAREPK